MGKAGSTPPWGSRRSSAAARFPRSAAESRFEHMFDRPRVAPLGVVSSSANLRLCNRPTGRGLMKLVHCAYAMPIAVRSADTGGRR
jgi:hypothetical protein